jgi:hypothetical protein
VEFETHFGNVDGTSTFIRGKRKTSYRLLIPRASRTIRDEPGVSPMKTLKGRRVAADADGDQVWPVHVVCFLARKTQERIAGRKRPAEADGWCDFRERTSAQLCVRHACKRPIPRQDRAAKLMKAEKRTAREVDTQKPK